MGSPELRGCGQSSMRRGLTHSVRHWLSRPPSPGHAPTLAPSGVLLCALIWLVGEEGPSFSPCYLKVRRHHGESPRTHSVIRHISKPSFVPRFRRLRYSRPNSCCSYLAVSDGSRVTRALELLAGVRAALPTPTPGFRVQGLGTAAAAAAFVCFVESSGLGRVGWNTCSPRLG